MISRKQVMLTTGNQLRAARALIGMEQIALSDASGIAVNTIRRMEKRGPEMITSSLENVLAVQAALERAGVEFTNGGQPGVRLRK
jgi:transcriptional regulator with XRE-family HTH domain